MLSTTTGFLVLFDLHEGRFLKAHQLVPESNVHLGYTPEGQSIIDDGMRFLGERPSTRVCPGSRWANVAPGAFHPITGLIYRPNDTVCVRQGLRPSVEGDAAGGFGELWLAPRPRLAEDYYDRWGALSAIDPDTGTVIWSFESGYPHDAGVLTTAGMLVFSVFADRFFRAFDAATGEVLFQQPLPSHGEGSPITYLVDGVQYVAVLVGHEHGVAAIPSSNLPLTIPGPAVLFVFALEGALAETGTVKRRNIP
jgi:outer membrane protein assembly factor BamB